MSAIDPRWGASSETDARGRMIVHARWTETVCAWMAENPTRDLDNKIVLGATATPEATVMRTFGWLYKGLPKDVLEVAVREVAAMKRLETARETRVVKVGRDAWDVYVGRGPQGRIPNPPGYGWAGNPFHVREHGPNAITLHAEYLWKRVERDDHFRRSLRACAGKRLGCHCVYSDGTGECHGKTLATWIIDDAKAALTCVQEEGRLLCKSK